MRKPENCWSITCYCRPGSLEADVEIEFCIYNDRVLRYKPCKGKEQKQDWAEGEVKLQHRPHKTVRELWSKYGLTVSPLGHNGLIFLPHLISHTHTHTSHIIISGELFQKDITSTDTSPTGADSFELFANCMPHSWAARSSQKGR